MFTPFWFLSGKKKQTEQKAPAAPSYRKVVRRKSDTLEKSEGTPYYKVVCPYCLAKYDIWNLEFRSMSVQEGDRDDGQKGYPREIDEKYVDFWRKMKQSARDPEQNHVLNIRNQEDVLAVKLWGSEEWIPMNTDERRARVAKKAIRSVKDKFGRESSRRICPMCHNDLPDVIGLYPNYVFTLMGNTSSGKTVYASRLLLSLVSGELLPERKMVVRVPGETLVGVRARLRKMFTARVSGRLAEGADQKLLIKDAITGEIGEHPIGAPEDDSGVISEATPIKYIKPTVLDMQRGEEHVLITMYDFPGEAIWRSDIMKHEDIDLGFFSDLMDRMNCNTNGWLFMLDSTTLPEVRDMVKEKGEEAYLSQENLYDEKLNAAPDEVLEPFMDWFGDGSRIKPPVAFVFSKADMLSRYAEDLSGHGYKIAPDSLFLQESKMPQRQYVDVDQLWQCDREIEEFLNSNAVIAAANNFCPTHAWFAVSATGAPVKNGQLESSAAGRRITDPLEWLLWMNGAYLGTYTEGKVSWADDIQSNDKG